MNKQTSDLFDMNDPFAIIVQSSTGVHQCPEKFLIHSPEYYFVMHYKYLNKVLAELSEVSAENTFSSIQYMADSLMKNMIFRACNIPIRAWVLLEPMGTLGRQYKKLFDYMFPEITPAVRRFLEYYDKCKAFEWKSYNETNQVIFNLESCLKHLSRLYKLYIQLAPELSKRTMVTVLEQYAQQPFSTKCTEGMSLVEDSNYTYYFKHVMLTDNIDILSNISFDWDLSKINFTLGECTRRSVINGLVVDLGISRDVTHPFVRYQEALLNIVSHLQTADTIYLGYLCEQSLNAINIQYRELPLLGIFSEESESTPLSELIDKAEEFSGEKIQNHKMVLVNALYTLENYYKYSADDVCKALAVISEVFAIEAEHFDVFKEYLEVDEFVEFMRGLDRFKDKDFDNYRVCCSETENDSPDKYSQEYFEKHLIERYNKPAICMSMFPSAKVIKWFNNL